ncbi:MAG: type I-E CRISPR-associated protein Cas7/Cse4/CasC [Clostridiales bacterium]|jgi:CRISPR system Cascade subunit CasC|nr:type I-E CRISPR-associated protein Cas7/Cse4/CasC [Clostridiales bacterium]
MKKVVYLDLHVIQSVPPSCLNRDDTGSPKTAIYGGARRARVSSQAWKRAMRLMFKDYFDESELGTRTLRVYELIAAEILNSHPEVEKDEGLKKAQDILKKVKVNPSKKGAEDKVDALFFLSAQQAKNLSLLAMGETHDKDEEKEIIKALRTGNSIDVALFGRMVAANPLLNCDASAQVAHAISTHRVENEYDYFTAIDDLSPEDNAGAGMIGTVEYNSATLYRYATVAAHELHNQLAGDPAALEKAIREFTRAFICAMPTGKQNTFAAHTLPDAVLAAVRTDRPLSLAGAFESPVRGEGITAASAMGMEKYAESVYADFCAKPEKSYVIGPYLPGLGERVTLDGLLERIGKDICDTV